MLALFERNYMIYVVDNSLNEGKVTPKIHTFFERNSLIYVVECGENCHPKYMLYLSDLI